MSGKTRLVCLVSLCVLYVVGANDLTNTPEPTISVAPSLTNTPEPSISVAPNLTPAPTAIPERGRRWKKEYVGNTPKHFKAIAKFDFRHGKGLKATQHISPRCGSVKEPNVDTAVPKWARNQSSTDLANTSDVTHVTDEQGKAVAAFELEGDVVIKVCDTKVLMAVVWWVRAIKGATPPNYSIYFDCTGPMYTITVPATLQFGSSTVAATWSLIAPYQNIRLNGNKKVRSMSLIGRGAQLTVYGITFYRGWSVCPVTSVSSGDSSVCAQQDYGGGAILVEDQASLVAQNCHFEDNRSDGLFARWSGGGAIKGETEANVLVWGCTFENNQALGGGAIAVSSSYVLYIESSTFIGNSALGGMDGSAANKGLKKNKLLLLGGAVRVDSITGNKQRKAHVVLCNSTFERNWIEFSLSRLEETFDYSKESAAIYLKAKGAVANLWNTNGNLDLEAGDVQFTTVQNCSFASNYEKVLQDTGQMGAYVVAISGAGNTDLAVMTFQDNAVRQATMQIEIGSVPADDMIFQVNCQQISFAGDSSALEYINAELLTAEQAICTFSNVDGIQDGSGPCVTYVENSQN